MNFIILIISKNQTKHQKSQSDWLSIIPQTLLALFLINLINSILSKTIQNTNQILFPLKIH
jgi:hypothetical protein